ncbi:ABC transporter substrate-binding protein [Aureimonas leprariae]|uniref:ABC transporter substrate-binding protein n=2 Tax=Plantimonas leprariae TaxID=2615207 RepID=A0A7V7PTR7_9HYPH|nr:ABC transporter substrate-binding protein [Aureimonas leprariae]
MLLAGAGFAFAPRFGFAEDAPAGGEAPAAKLAATPLDGDWKASTSLIGPSKYPGDFKHYDYVNPDAPKGGTVRSATLGTYDSFNPFIVRGTPAAGLVNFGGGLLYDTLMEQSVDEAATSHAMVAEAVRYPADFRSATFRLDPAARWHDGRPITAADVVWSFETLKTLHPQWATYYKNVIAAEATGEREVTFRFDQANNRELPAIMGDLTILPKHWWEGTDAKDAKRDISQPTLEPPLGSGPYRIESFDTGRSIRWKRVPDYWAAMSPTRVGRYNADEIVYSYFRDQNASWDAFRKGGIDDWRIEYSSQRWSEGYDFPAAKSGKVIRKTLKSYGVESMQAFVLNNRLPKFADRRVRQALTLAFDFETMNRTLFFGLNQRISSYWANSELAATGLPTPAELKLLEPLRDQVPPEVFTSEFKLPVYDTPASARTYLRQAFDLLQAAGYAMRNSALVDAKGQPFTVEFLGDDPSDNRVLDPFVQQLGRLGIRANVRIVDANQYTARMRAFDFEAVAMKYYPQSLSPGNEQRDFWSSGAADAPGSRNYAGVKSPAVDRLIDAIVFAPDRETQVAATRALDRVMLWNFFVVPQWFRADIWLAYWNRFGMPERQPEYTSIDPYSWWIAEAAPAGAAP